ncbi:transporter substrate-binding domain-containing protein [Geminicoccaceae bacterium 1502E]|nr:transporter substrate-binding domain-containing protein [Geminicoccaceae bacterium 1502E]
MRQWVVGIFSLLVLTGCGGAPATAAPDGALRLAVEGNYAPFSMVDKKGNLSGFDVDIANALCKQLEVKCVLVRRDWATIQDGILGTKPALWKDVDAVVASVSISDGRRATTDFTRAYYQVPARFVRRKGTKAEVTDTLAGQAIGVQQHTTHDKFLTRRFPDARIVRTATLGEAGQALADGKVELLFGDALALQSGPLAGKQGTKLEFTGPNFDDPAWFGQGAGVAVKKGDAALRDKLEKALQAIRDSGQYKDIAARYFRFDIAGR